MLGDHSAFMGHARRATGVHAPGLVSIRERPPRGQKGLLKPFPSFQAPVRRPRDEPMRCTLVSSLLRSAVHWGNRWGWKGFSRGGFPSCAASRRPEQQAIIGPYCDLVDLLFADLSADRIPCASV